MVYETVCNVHFCDGNMMLFPRLHKPCMYYYVCSHIWKFLILRIAIDSWNTVYYVLCFVVDLVSCISRVDGYSWNEIPVIIRFSMSGNDAHTPIRKRKKFVKPTFAYFREINPREI